MPEPRPVPATADQRLLAAIVFTDVAGFSRRVQVEEAVTLKLLERDFVTMRAFCSTASGRVVKSTGDGLLLFFASAVHAVEWALKTQRHFADQAAELPREEVLRHRIGIHVGDVILAGDDVMGDGVNVAARLQAAAPPGGICVSQEVFGVVKNKMKLDVVRLEPRQLKNINEPVQMYHVLLHPPTQRMAPVVPKPEVIEAAPPPAAAWKRWTAVGLGLAVVAGGTFALFKAHKKVQEDLAGSQEVRAAVAALSAQEKAALEQPAAANPAEAGSPPGPAAATKAGEAGRGPARAAGATAPQFDFAKAAANRRAGAPATPELQSMLSAAQAALPALEKWRLAAMRRFTEDQPLFVTPLTQGKMQSWTVHFDAANRIWFSVGGAKRPSQWNNLSIEERGAILAALVRNTPATPPEVMRAAEAFALVHGLPEMAEMLLRERSGR